jgi:hypothetical protein
MIRPVVPAIGGNLNGLGRKFWIRAYAGTMCNMAAGNTNGAVPNKTRR